MAARGVVRRTLPVSIDDKELLKEFLEQVKDVKHKALVEAYIKKPEAESMSDKALELLSKALDED